MHLYEEGITVVSILKQYGKDYAQLKVIWVNFLKYAKSGLAKRINIKVDFALKRIIVLDIE